MQQDRPDVRQQPPQVSLGSAFTLGAMLPSQASLENPDTFNNYLKSFIAYGKYLGVHVPFKRVNTRETRRIPRSALARRYTAARMKQF